MLINGIFQMLSGNKKTTENKWKHEKEIIHHGSGSADDSGSKCPV